MAKAGVAESRHVHYLKCAPIFEGVADRTLALLAQSSRWRQLERGDYVFFQGDPAGSAYVVCSGWIVIVLNSAGGRELVINEMRDGDLFGESAIVAGIPRTATAVARQTTAILEIPRPVFVRALDDEPVLVRRLLEVEILRISHGNERQSALAFLDGPGRVARLLREMDELERQTTDKGYITLSQEELALRTGLTRQTVARFLGQWRRRGWLVTGRGRIMLLRHAELEKVEESRLL